MKGSDFGSAGMAILEIIKNFSWVEEQGDREVQDGVSVLLYVDEKRVTITEQPYEIVSVLNI